MPVRNTPAEYGLMTKALHWVIVVVMALQFLVGYTMTRIDDDEYEGMLGLSEDRLFVIHTSLGVTVLALALIRLIWRASTRLPDWASTLTHFERRFAHLVERGLYLLMFAVPLSGILAALADDKNLVVFGIFKVPNFLPDIDDLDDLAIAFHIFSHLAFFAVASLHVGLIVKHQVVNRDRLLNRML